MRRRRHTVLFEVRGTGSSLLSPKRAGGVGPETAAKKGGRFHQGSEAVAHARFAERGSQIGAVDGSGSHDAR
jgi:hypothetical protein